MFAAPIVGSVVGYQYGKVLNALFFFDFRFPIVCRPSTPVIWTEFSGQILGAAIALGGCAIWFMHFIAVAAYKNISLHLL